MTPKEFKAARKKLKLSQFAMAGKMGFSDASAISLKENGHREITGRDVIIIESLLEKAGKKKPKEEDETEETNSPAAEESSSES